MQDNPQFIQSIINTVESYQRQPTSGWTLFKANDTAATRIFIAAVNGAKNGTNEQTKDIPIIHALFQYGIARNLSSSTISENRLYYLVIQALGDNYYIPNPDPFVDHTTIIKDFIVGLQHLEKKSIKDIALFVKNITELANLLSTLRDESQKITVFKEAQLIERQIQPQLVAKNSYPVLDNPIVIGVLKQRPELAIQLLSQLKINTLFGTQEITINWLQLLKTEAIQYDAQINGHNFIQYWLDKHYQGPNHFAVASPGVGDSTGFLGPLEEIPVAKTILKLITDKILDGLPSQIQGKLLSLKCTKDNTILEELALAYPKHPQVIKDLMITVLTKMSLAVVYETKWFEILMPYIQDIQSCDEILDLIPKEMFNALYKERLHEKINKQLNGRLEEENFWIGDYKDNMPENMKILLTISFRIIEGQVTNSAVNSDNQALDRFIENSKIYKNLRKNEIRNKREKAGELFPTDILSAMNEPMDVYGNGDFVRINTIPELDKIKQKCNLRLHTGNNLNDWHQEIAFTQTFYIIHYIQYQLLVAFNPEVMPSEVGLIEKTYKISKDDYGYIKEIVNFTQKSLIQYLSKGLPSKQISQEEHLQQTSTRLVLLIWNIEKIFDYFSLDFNQLVLENDELKLIVKNILISQKAFVNNQNAPGRKLRKLISLYEVFLETNDDFPDFETSDESSKILDALYALYESATDYLHCLAGFHAKKDKNEINLNCAYTIIHANQGNICGTQSHSTKMVQCISTIIEYRILSFSDDTYIKSYYRDYLKDVLEKHPLSEISWLAKYKVYFIAQVNTSLRQLPLEKYTDKLRAAALKDYLDSLTDIGIRISDLDQHSQNIYQYLEICAHCTSLNLKFGHQLMKILNNYAKNDGFESNDDVENIITLLLVHNKSAHNELMQLPILINACKTYKNILSSLHNRLHANEFRNVWLLLLKYKVVNTTVFNHQPIIQYFAHDDRSSLYNTLDMLDMGLQKEIIKAPYQKTMQLNSFNEYGIPNAQYKNLNQLLENISNNDQVNVETYEFSKKFNPANWCSLYSKESNNACIISMTLLQESAMLISDVNMFEHECNRIITLLKYKPTIDNEQNNIWIEILLAALHNKKPEEKNRFITQILPLIPKEMLQAFIDKGLISTFTKQLLKNTNPIAEHTSDSAHYKLYLHFIITAIFECPESFVTNGDLIKNVCTLLPFYKETFSYFIEKYNGLESEVGIKKIFDKYLTDEINNAPVPYVRKEKACKELNISCTAENNDIQLLNARVICIYMQEILLMGPSKLPKETIQLVFGTFIKSSLDSICEISDQSIENMIYVATQYNMEQSLQHDSKRWKSHQYILRLFEFIDIICRKSKLDCLQLLPKSYNDILDMYYKNITFYGEKDKMPEGLVVIDSKLNERWGASNITLAPKIPSELTMPYDFVNFIKEISSKSDAYLNDESNTSKPGNGTNVNCARKICQLFETNANNIESGSQLLSIQLLYIIISYLFESYNEYVYEKGFYKKALKNPLDQLNNSTIVLPDAYKELFQQHVMNHLRALPIASFSQEKKGALCDTIQLFNKLLSIDCSTIAVLDETTNKMVVQHFNNTTHTNNNASSNVANEKEIQLGIKNGK